MNDVKIRDGGENAQMASNCMNDPPREVMEA